MAGRNGQAGPQRTPADAGLVRRFCAGDRDAFVELYDRYAALVRAITYDATGRLVDAQDLAQEVFLRAWQKRGELRDPDKFSAWLIGISRRVCLEWRRKRGRDRLQPGDVDANEVATTEKRTDGEAFDELHHALLQLSDTERLALHLFYLQDEPAEPARALLGLSRSGFYKLLDRARHKLRELMSEHQESER